MKIDLVLIKVLKTLVIKKESYYLYSKKEKKIKVSLILKNSLINSIAKKAS